jgi:two-component system CheB/CheR fusion protein
MPTSRDPDYRALLETLPLGVFVADSKGRALFVNERFRSLTGAPAEAPSGEEWLTRVPPADRERVIKEWDDATSAGRDFHVETPVELPDGELLTLECRATPLVEHDRTFGYIGVIVDVTERHRLERQKDEFLGMLAHELRNPIAALTNGLELLDQTTDSTMEGARYLAIFRRQLGSLARIVDDLLDVSRLTRGVMSMRCEFVDLVAALKNAIHANRAAIDRRGHHLVTRVGSGPFVVNGDRTRLEQIFANLLSNAVKFTPPNGHIWVVVDRAGSEREGLVRVSVQDDGDGIPEAMLQTIFEPFVQRDDSLHRAEGGLGIGLTLARRLAEMHGGKIECASCGLGKGSTFTVELPLADAAAREVPEKPVVIPKQGSKRVVVVEDNPDARETLKELLESFGYRVDVAGDGPSGTELIARVRPDVAILDVGLPGMDGYELARRVRAHPELCAIRLVAVTGYGDDTARRRAREAGFNVHLTKPASGADLIAALS